MKRVNLLLILALISLVISGFSTAEMVSEDEYASHEDVKEDSCATCTQVYRIESGSQVSLLEKIVDKLQRILNKLQVLIDKSEEECKWEKFNQKQEINLAASHICCGFWNITSTLHMPGNIAYAEARALSARAVLEFTPFDEWGVGRFYINGVDCGRVQRDEIREFQFPPECVSALNEGFNQIVLSISENSYGKIHSVFLETEIKPTSC